MTDRKRSPRVAIITKDEGDDFYSAHIPSLPGCYSMGETLESVTANILEEADLFLTSLEEDGVPIPEPGSEWVAVLWDPTLR